MKATIREIAERVGVSSASVSLVLNHRDCRISEETSGTYSYYDQAYYSGIKFYNK